MAVREVAEPKKPQDKDDADDVQQLQFKVILLGDGAVGKTSISRRFSENQFNQMYKQTVGVDFFIRRINIPPNYHITLQLWDIGGQSLNSKSLAQYLASTDAIFMVYDITNSESFNNLNDWLLNIKKYATNVKYIYVVGNKIDLINLRQALVDAKTITRTNFEVSKNSRHNRWGQHTQLDPPSH